METATKKLLEEIGEIEYGVFKDTYCKLQDLRSLYNGIYETMSSTGVMPDFKQLQAVHLLLEDVYRELEHFLLPLCAEEEGCGPSMCNPK
jgi:hypothetical protein